MIMQAPIYLALDFPDWQTGRNFLKQNDLGPIPVKVGMELFYKEGRTVIEELKSDGHEVFLDLKLHDIPHTVKQAMHNLAGMGVDIVNLHATGGPKMIESAKEGLVSGAISGKVPKLLGVTVLTSFDDSAFKQAVKTEYTVEEMVVFLARQVKENGGDGIVCSSWEAKKVLKMFGQDFLTMCPGIRLSKADGHDQKRIATPEEARENGAQAIVIGRSVTGAGDPYQAWEQAKKEWYGVIEA